MTFQPASTIRPASTIGFVTEQAEFHISSSMIETSNSKKNSHQLQQECQRKNIDKQDQMGTFKHETEKLALEEPN